MPHARVRLLAGFLTAIVIFGALFAPVRPAKAQLIVSDINTGLKWVWEKVKDLSDTFWETAGRTALINALNYGLQTVAYDTATWLASAAAGEQPAGFGDSFDQYLLNVAKDAGGKAIESLSESFKLNLCKPTVPTLAIKIQFGAALDFGVAKKPPKPACDFDEMLKNYESVIASLDSTDEFLSRVGVVFTSGKETDIGVVGEAYKKVLFDTIAKKEGKAKEREEGQGFRGKTTEASKKIETPAQQHKESAGDLTPPKVAKEEREIKKEVISDAEKPEVAVTILSNAASVFASTFAGQLMKNLKKHGLFPLATIDVHEGIDGPLQSPTAQFTGGAQQAKLVYADFLVPRIKQGGNVDLLTEFLSCPPSNPGINNCVIDQSFENAVRRADGEQPLTIREAIDQGLLHGEWQLLSPRRSENVSPSCASQAYCFSNLAKLRLARIIPLGFELAANLSPDDHPWTLREAVDGFNNCGTGGTWDAAHRFCHLIDPNWVLKAPPAQCRARVFGSRLVSPESNQREEVCADIVTSVAEDEKGGPLGAWGHCVREKNVWRLDADSCPAQFASCSTFVGRQGKTASYLASTIDHGVCTADNVGCLGYFTERTADGTWKSGAADKKIYFDAEVKSCNAAADGCTEFVRTDATSLFARKAPDHLGCYDADQGKAGVQWPINAPQAEKLAGKQACAPYAPVCAGEEIGCEEYTPKSGASKVTGIVGQGDSCPNECVGYAAFKQIATNFESAKFPTYLIPATGTQCSATHAGCDEFTNLDKLAQGGEAREYYQFLRHCVKPGEDTEGTYYTWEGSDTAGLQIKVWSLVAGDPLSGEPIGANPPQYHTQDAVKLAEYQAACNKQAYQGGAATLDCREMYDAQGRIFYRLVSKTISVSNDCRPLRKTFSTDGDCTASGGAWTNGACLYKAIPAEGIKCPAVAAGCRAYQGQSGTNIEVVFNDQFESTSVGLDALGWKASGKGIAYSNESLVPGGHSLQVKAGATNVRREKVTLARGSTYTLRLWAKGVGTLAVQFRYTWKDVNNQSHDEFFAFPGTVTLTNSWQEYAVGPVEATFVQQVTDANVVGELRFSGFSADSFFDNVQLTRGKEVYLIRGSSKVPASCDANPNDTLPGEMLGCELYKTRTGGETALKSFTRLCRAKAVGCEALADTFNSASGLEEKFNDPPPGQVQDDTNADDVTVPADGYVYLVNQKQFYCQAQAKGCRAFGQKTGSGVVTTYRVNDPDTYESILCTAKADGCEAFASKTGEGTLTSYFKDPTLVGKECEYKTAVDTTIGTPPYTGVSGWFKKGTSDPCYTNNMQAGPSFGIWNNGDALFDGYAGLCEQKYATCTEFRDPWDSSPSNPKGEAYYVLDNGKLDRQSCGGQSSLREGCVLFDKVDDPAKLWSAGYTYLLSELKKEAPVSPATDPNLPNDANTLLKVRRDRTCAEWLSCASERAVFDPSQGKTRLVCTDVRLCEGVKGGFAGGAQSLQQCGTWVPLDAQAVRKIDTAYYTGRDVTWKGRDFSGHVTANQIEPQHMRVVRVGDAFELRAVDTSSSSQCTGQPDGIACGVDSEGRCYGGACTYEVTNDPQQKDDAVAPVAIGPSCRGFPEVDAPFPATVVTTWSAFGKPIEKLASFQGSNALREYARYSMPDENGEKVEREGPQGAARNTCDYRKVTYGATLEPLFFLPQFGVPAKICEGGFTKGGVSKDGRTCEDNFDCEDKRTVVSEFKENGFCRLQKKVTNFTGWQGFCLEPDLRTPINGTASEFACLTWYPVDLAGGVTDIYNQYHTAGYVPPENAGRYYCALSSGNLNDKGPPYTYAYPVDKQVKKSSTQSSGGVGGGGCPKPDPNCGNNPVCVEDFCVNSNTAINYPTGNNWSYFIVTDETHHKYEVPWQGEEITLGDLDFIRLVFTEKSQATWPQENSIAYIPFEDTWRCYAKNASDCLFLGELKTEVEVRKGEEGKTIYHENKEQLGFAGIKKISDTTQEAFFTWVDGDNRFKDLDTDPTLGVVPSAGEGKGCGIGGDNKPENNGGIRFIFTSAGSGSPLKLASVRVGVCQGGSGAGDLERFAVKVSFFKREQCTAPIAVVQSAAGNNAAFTNRTWDLNNPTNPSADRRIDRSGAKIPYSPLPGIFYTANAPPFGSIGVGSEHNFNDNPVYTFAHDVNNILSNEPPISTPRLSRGISYSCPQGNCAEESQTQSLSIASQGTTSQGTGYVGTFFARSFVEETTACPSSGANGCFDDRNDKGNAPTIASFDSATCNLSGACTYRKKDAFNVNGKDAGNVFIAQSGIARMQFYGWADTDQMPLRTVTVDWNDGSNFTGGNDGKYKNHKPECSEAPLSDKSVPARLCVENKKVVNMNATCRTTEDCVVITGSNANSCQPEKACSISGDNCVSNLDCTTGEGTCEAYPHRFFTFGNDPAACTQGFFEFTHSYAYSSNCGAKGTHITNESDTLYKDLAQFGVQPGHPLCVFKPKVQLKDNWGWCNGVKDYPTDMTPKGRIDTECNAQNQNSWTYFGGTIIVAK